MNNSDMMPYNDNSAIPHYSDDNDDLTYDEMVAKPGKVLGSHNHDDKVKRQLAKLIAEGATTKEAAAECGVPYNTAKYWRQKSPIFIESYNHQSALLNARNALKSSYAINHAISKIDDCLDTCGDDAYKLAAVVNALKGVWSDLKPKQADQSVSIGHVQNTQINIDTSTLRSALLKSLPEDNPPQDIIDADSEPE